MSPTNQKREQQIGSALEAIASDLKGSDDLDPAVEQEVKARLIALADELGGEIAPPPPPPPPASAVPSFSARHLKAILPGLQDVEKNFAELQKAALEFKLTTFDRMAQFLGQVSHETGGGQFFEELGDERYFRSFLGDQWQYHGHGAIMLTWRDTYAKCASYFKNPAILNTPDTVSRPEWRWRTALWFWTTYKPVNLNTLADVVDFDGIMRNVLGTSNHPSYDERWNGYVRACQNLPIPFALAGKYRTNVDRALAYILPARGKINYEWWTSGALRDGSPAWSANAAPPPIGKVTRGFCAAIPNLMLRKVGKRIPFRTNLPSGVDPREWDGGIAAYFGGTYGGAYFADYMRPIQNADADRPHGTLLGSKFYGSAAQGHVGVVLGNGRLLDLNSVDDFQSRYWASSAIRRFGFTHYVLPPGWIEYSGDEF
jgi:predicted chitinase